MPNADNSYSDKQIEELFAVNLQETVPDDNSSSQTEPTSTESSNETEGQNTPNEGGAEDVEKTKAFAKRLKERTDKAVADERERLAKEFGYESYDDMQKKKERKLFEDQGIDPELVNPIVDKLVEQRLANDPRMKELDSYRQAQAEEFAKKELQELTKLTGVQYSSLDDVPKDVVEDWKTSGSIKQSYLKLHGEELVKNTRRAAAKGSTDHLQSNAGSPSGNGNLRTLTDQEKRVWKQFYPGITDEELNKKLVSKE